MCKKTSTFINRIKKNVKNITIVVLFGYIMFSHITSFTIVEALTERDPLTKVQKIAKNIYTRSQRWQWHDGKTQWHEHQKQKLHELNSEDRNRCKTLYKDATGENNRCPDYSLQGYWLPNGGTEDYKAERMKFLQDYAREQGLSEYALDLVAQLNTENGSWDENVRGDGGCAIGIPQFNVCFRKSLKGKKELTNWRWQIRAFVDEIKVNFIRYKNFSRAQVGWNNPQAMVINEYHTAYYYKIERMKEQFEFVKNKKQSTAW